jgi:ribosomal protein S18 acetylase RimI-like enzyme
VSTCLSLQDRQARAPGGRPRSGFGLRSGVRRGATLQNRISDLRLQGRGTISLVMDHVSLSIAGSEVAEDLARLWVRASARRRRQSIPGAPEPERVAALAHRVGRPGAAAVVAMDEDVAVGCCFFEPLTEPDRETIIDGAAHLSGLAVEPSRWGEGLATAILVFAEAEVRRRGFQLLRLHVLEENERARALYERLGWSLVATGYADPSGPQAVYDKSLTE